MTFTATKPASLPGTRPQGARDEHEARARVQQMFGRIVPRYDFLNHLLSFSFDRLWRRRAARHFLHVLARPEARVLDLCCGTGDLAFAFDRARASAISSPMRFPIFGADFVLPMLDRARSKAAVGRRMAAFLAADALVLPFRDASFDLVAAAFGFRNLSNYGAGMQEIARILKPGGEVGILEFAEPERGLMASLFRFYFRRVVPIVGGIISGSREAYSYLPESVAKFPSTDELVRQMKDAGFTDVQDVRWNFGSVALHMGRRAGKP